MKLADRIEQADGPSRELDAEIAQALGFTVCPEPSRASPRIYGGDISKGNKRNLPAFTASLDAAMSLVKDEWRESIHLTWNRAIVWDSIGRASTPALALCAAAIRAQEAGE